MMSDKFSSVSSDLLYTGDLIKNLKDVGISTIVMGIPIQGFSDFTIRNNFFRNRLLSMNIQNSKEILSQIGSEINTYKEYSKIPVENDYSVNYADDIPKQNLVTHFTANGYKEVHWDEENNLNDSVSDRDFLNENSMLVKVKKMFNNHKIDTLISRFHTDGKYQGRESTKYGYSHGNNLLTKQAEEGINTNKINGYDNPYCRVWTHYHQYDSLSKLIRPFSNDGKPVSIGELQKDWDFSRSKDGIKRLDNMTVLNKNGFINMVPTSEEGDKIDTKNCMFSIENLAWKGYDNYAFEKALSKEQRGPFGGRIMNFIPYGITFNENLTANWNNDTFIGRGEDVFSYINSDRSGNLSFQMVVDSPSIVNFVDSDKTSENDLRRFFSGCGTLEPKFKKSEQPVEYEIERIANIENENKEKESVENKDGEKQFCFFVFFPNNYSGYFDSPGRNVEAMAYLLNGTMCQKEGENNSPISFNDMRNRLSDNFVGQGYEMTKNIGVSEKGSNIKSVSNYITGSTNQIWKYRIDGDYKLTLQIEKDKNKYNEILIKENYTDKNNVNTLNSNYKTVETSKINGKIKGKLFSFAEVACVLSDNENIPCIKSKIEEAIGIEETSERLKEIENILNNYKISKIDISGFANSHGTGSGKITKNEELAKDRANTVRDWLNDLSNKIKCDNIKIDSDSTEKVNNKDVSNPESKSYRSAMVLVTYDTSETKTLAETEQAIVSGDTVTVIGFQESILNNQVKIGERTLYKDDKGFYYEKVGDNLVRVTLKEKIVQTEGTNTDKEENIRYDNEADFFTTLKDKFPSSYSKLTEKIKYFLPVYHSTTPEGFNTRLTFLQQCTRQGNTIGASDLNSPKSANNLSFGRPPICVLRLGDFYYTKIIIRTINIDYDPIL
ncbi:hypothetical protein EZS27_007730, partial [termite gut metagenome]